MQRPLNERLASAWGRHPLVTFTRHRRQIAFYRQFHALIRAGLGMPMVFAELTKYAPDPMLERGLRAVAKDIQGGSTLGKALSRHSSLFEDSNVELIAFAEEAGTLDVVLASLISHLEEVNRLRWRTIFMTLWPMYLLLAFIFVGPLLNIAQSMNSTTSVGVLYLSGLFRNLVVAGVVIAALVGAPMLIVLMGLELQWDELKRRLPVVSSAVRDIYASRMLLGLGLGLGAGLEVMRTLRVAVVATGSPSLISALPKAEATIQRGGTLTEAVDSLGLLDRVTLGTLSVAERTGTISDTLTRLSRELQDASVRAVRILTIVVLVIVASVLLVSIVGSMLGTILGPVKHLYDAAGSGELDKL
jgi:type II secretory pathway component PulF